MIYLYFLEQLIWKTVYGIKFLLKIKRFELNNNNSNKSGNVFYSATGMMLCILFIQKRNSSTAIPFYEKKNEICGRKFLYAE